MLSRKTVLTFLNSQEPKFLDPPTIRPNWSRVYAAFFVTPDIATYVVFFWILMFNGGGKRGLFGIYFYPKNSNYQRSYISFCWIYSHFLKLGTRYVAIFPLKTIYFDNSTFLIIFSILKYFLLRLSLKIDRNSGKECAGFLKRRLNYVKIKLI